MGWIDDFLGEGIDYEWVKEKLTCKVPYDLRYEWPITGPPRKPTFPLEWSDGASWNMYPPCHDWVGWEWTSPYKVEVVSSPDGMAETLPFYDPILAMGVRYTNMKTGEEIWTVDPTLCDPPLLSESLSDTPGGPTDEEKVEWAENFKDIFTLADPKAGTPVSPPDPVSPGLPPCVSEPDPATGHPEAGGLMVLEKTEKVKKAGFPWWGWLLGAGVVGGLMYTSMRKGKKRKRPAWERP